MLFGNDKYLIEWGADGTEFFNYDNTGQSLGKISSLTEKVDPGKSTISTSVLSYDVFNKADVFSTFLYNKLNTTGKMLFNEIVKLYKIGTQGEKIIIYKGYIRSVVPSQSREISYRINLESVVGKLKGKVWDRELSEYSNETVAQINTNRMSSGFVISEYTEDSKTLKKINYSGHILDCFKGLIQMKLSSPVLDSNTMFLDTNYLDFLDITTFNEVKGVLNSPIYNITFEWKEAIENLFEFLQYQIFQAIGILPSVTGDGKIRIALHQQPSTTVGIESFDESKIIEYSSREIDNSNIINNMVVRYNYNDDKFLSGLYRADVQSFEFFGNELYPESPKKIELKSINNLSPSDQNSFCTNLIDRMFSRFSREINTLSIIVPIQLAFNTVIAGDFINVNSRTLIDWKTGKRGFATEDNNQDPNPRWNNGDSWGGFINNNNIGTGTNGSIVIDTRTEEIVTDFLRSTTKPSLQLNQDDVSVWLATQGV